MRSRTVALLVGMVLVTAACGARLTPEQRAAALGGGGVAPGAGGPGATTSPGAVPTDASGSPLPTPSGGATGPGGGAGPAAAACPEGELKASDTGVTPTEISLGTLADLSGVQTGLFKSAADAMQAFAAYVNNEGGICGRQVAVQRRDTQTNSGGNDAQTKESCNQDFAMVGSMSAFDSGGYEAGNACGIPAIPAVSTNAWKQDEIFPPNYYPAYPNRPDQQLDTAAYIEQVNRGAKSNAGLMWLAQSVARTNAGGRGAAYKQRGWQFNYHREAQVVETNYSSYVSQMKAADIKYLTFVGNYQSIVNLLEAMDQQSWHPDVLDFDSVVYSPVFLEDLKGDGISTENLYWFTNTALFEEASSNPEMQLYMDWLERTGGGAPDYFGLYAWSAGRLFQEVATKVGPNLTRKAFLAELAKVKTWEGHGLHAPHRTSEKLATACYLYGKIENYEFKRVAPASGWMCDHQTRTVPYPSRPDDQ